MGWRGSAKTSWRPCWRESSRRRSSSFLPISSPSRPICAAPSRIGQTKPRARNAMAEKLLKFPDAAGEPAIAKPTGLKGLLRRSRRMILLVVVPTIAAVAGLGFYLSGGRYISTDNAYVGAQKVLITPDISGKVSRIVVREGQHVAPGDILFEIDSAPFKLALAEAQAKLASVRVDLANLKSNIKSLTTLAELAQKNVELKQRDVERKSALVAKSTGSQLELDNAASATVTAQLAAQFTLQQKTSTLNQLLGDPD